MRTEVEKKGRRILERILSSGIRLEVVGVNALRVVGEVSDVQKEYIRLWKRQIIDELSPKCSECDAPLELIRPDLWFCRLGCESREV